MLSASGSMEGRGNNVYMNTKKMAFVGTGLMIAGLGLGAVGDRAMAGAAVAVLGIGVAAVQGKAGQQRRDHGGGNFQASEGAHGSFSFLSLADVDAVRALLLISPPARICATVTPHGATRVPQSGD